MPGVSADQLYTRAKAFLFKAFSNAEKVIQIDDKAGGLLAGKGLLNMQMSTGAIALNGGGAKYYTPIELRFKDGKYRYEISGIQIWSQDVKIDLDDAYRKSKVNHDRVFSEKEYQKTIKTNQPFINLIANLKMAMSQNSGKEDW